MTLPPSPQSLFSVDIPPDFIEEYEDRQNRERVYWRGRAREARDRRLMEEQSAAAPMGKSPSRPSVQATPIAAGSGPRRAIEVGYLLFNLNDSQFVFSSLPVLIRIPR